MDKKTKVFIEKARKVHGSKFDYRKAEYVRSSEKVKIICKIHGEFEQTPGGHLRGRGCSKCSGHYTPTTEEWIEMAKEVHGDRYIYDKAKYTRSANNIKIICKIHGMFEQTANNHLRGAGCKECYDKTRTKTTETFIKEAKEVHGDRYIYDKAKYTGSRDNVTITCPVHGDFQQTPHSHLNGNGCNKCSGRYSPTTEEWIEMAKEVHKEFYDYSKAEYINNKAKVKIICNIHGMFEQTANNHLNGAGCNKCALGNMGWRNEAWTRRSERSQHFDSFKVYIIRCWNEEEEFIKIGKTFTTIEQRFSGKIDMPYNYEIIRIIEKETAEEATSKETELHYKLRDNKYTPEIDFGGMFECFTKNILKTLKI